jgi:hypothetical protein
MMCPEQTLKCCRDSVEILSNQNNVIYTLYCSWPVGIILYQYQSRVVLCLQDEDGSCYFFPV